MFLPLVILLAGCGDSADDSAETADPAMASGDAKAAEDGTREPVMGNAPVFCGKCDVE
jgi:hypothetical protein